MRILNITKAILSAIPKVWFSSAGIIGDKQTVCVDFINELGKVGKAEEAKNKWNKAQL